MWHEAEQIVAGRFLALAAAHHFAIVVVAVLFWVRRRSMERTVAVYFALAFTTATIALASHPPARVLAAFPAGLAALWFHEAARLRNVLSLRRAPRIRLIVAGALGLYGFVYPGYTGELPSFVFSPLGVVLPPTLLVALAVMNAAAPETNRPLHWTLAAVGLVMGVNGAVVGGWTHLPLIAAALYTAPLLLGRAVLTDERAETDATSVRAVHDRMHKRRVLLSKPRRSSVRRLDVRKRRR